MHPASGNDLKTVLLHRTAFLCVSRFLRLASPDTINALQIGISVTFQPLLSVIPKILKRFVSNQIVGSQIVGGQIIGYSLWTMDYGLKTIGYALWAIGYGLWSMGYGLSAMVYGLSAMQHRLQTVVNQSKVNQSKVNQSKDNQSVSQQTIATKYDFKYPSISIKILLNLWYSVQMTPKN